MVVEGEMDNNVTEPVTFWVGLIFLRISSDPKHLIPSHLISVMRRKKIKIIQNSSATKTNNLHLHRHWIITYISQNTESRYCFFQHPKPKTLQRKCGYCAGDGPNMDHHRAPGTMCGRADGWTLLPVRRSHRPAVQDLGAQQGGGDHRRAFWTRER